jgi:nucleoside-diphosphate-sugar epimerase
MRQRLDVIVNILTNLAFHKREITVFGGDQLRPNIHMNDMVRAYELLIEANTDQINGQFFNAGWENKTVNEIANLVRENLGKDIKIIKTKTDDNRSYHISSKKINTVLNFKTQFTIADAINDLSRAFKGQLLEDPLNNRLYYNIKRMNELKLK